MTAKSLNLVIAKGKTFKHVVRWEGETYTYSAITAVPNLAPVRLTSTTHGVPDQWRVAIVSVKGMTELNAANNPPKESELIVASRVDANTIELNGVNASTYKAYTSGGFIQYKTPVPLASFTARMSIKAKITTPTLLQTVAGGTSSTTRPTAAGTDGTVTWVSVTSGTPTTTWAASKIFAPNAIIDLNELMRLDTATTGITVDDTNKVITLSISATLTAAISWKRGVYDLELVSGSGEVTALLSGKVYVIDEVTTTDLETT